MGIYSNQILQSVHLNGWFYCMHFISMNFMYNLKCILKLEMIVKLLVSNDTIR